MRDITAKELLVIDIEIGKPTVDWAFGEALLQLFVDHDPRLVPQILTVWDNVVAEFAQPEDARPHWAGTGSMRINGSLSEFPVGLGWRRRLTTRYQAEITHETRDQRGRLIPARLTVHAAAHRTIDWCSFADSLYQLTQAHYGFVHLRRDAHLHPNLSEAREPTWGSHDRTAETVPQLGWSTHLGRPYAQITAPLLAQGPSGPVKAVGGGASITLSENIMDVADNYADFEATRKAAKTLFPEDFFRLAR